MGEGPLNHEEVLGHEVTDLQFAVHQDRQGRGHYPSDRPGTFLGTAKATCSQGKGPAARHADQPVGHRPAIGGIAQAFVCGPGFHRPVGLEDGGIGQGFGPQTQGRDLAPRLVQDQPGDELALAAGVGGDHDLGGLRQLRLDDLELVAGPADHLVFELVGNHRQDAPVPGLPGLVVLLGLDRLDQVSDGPGADRAVAERVGALHVALAPGLEAQGRRDGGPHRRLLGHNDAQFFGHDLGLHP